MSWRGRVERVEMGCGLGGDGVRRDYKHMFFRDLVSGRLGARTMDEVEGMLSTWMVC